jgi:cytochrome oxidase Cu insertion factor (SCO1/SenC/PrrC family)
VVPLVVVTVDPWRDAPERLTHVAAMWELSGEDRVLSGSVGEVLRVLGDWGVTVDRDAQTGDVTHPALVVLVDARGRVAARLPGDLRRLPALLRD